jgi:hypothetical protein
MEKRALLGTAASGCAMVLPNRNRALLLNVVPPPATTLRVMLNRALLWARTLVERETNRNKNKVFIVALINNKL